MPHPIGTGEDPRRAVHVNDMTPEEAKIILDALSEMYPEIADMGTGPSTNARDEVDAKEIGD